MFFIQDFLYFGVQNGDSCYCGSSMSRFIPAPYSQCDKPCVGNASQFCGSSWRMNIYQNGFEITPVSNFPLVHITGWIMTTRMFHKDFASKTGVPYRNFKNKTVKDIKKLLESNSLVVDAKVTLTNVTEETLKRRRQSAGKSIAHFIALISAAVNENYNIIAIKSSLKTTIEDASSNLYDSFNKKSFERFDLSIGKPNVIKIETPSKDEMNKKISKNVWNNLRNNKGSSNRVFKK